MRIVPRLHRISVAISVTLFFVVAAIAQQSSPITMMYEAEDYTEASSDVALDRRLAKLSNLHDGSWIKFENFHFLDGELDSVAVYYTREERTDWSIEFRLDSRTGTKIATVDFTEGAGRLSEIKVPISNVSGLHDLYIVVKTSSEPTGNLDRFAFIGKVSVPASSERKTYHVDAINGDDEVYSGESADTPFKTIQKAATLLKPGDKCIIHQGIYRETVRPWYTGAPGAEISFEAAPGEEVYISGADPVTGWEQHQGSIYKTTKAKPFRRYFNQLFVDGEMMWVARCPNVNQPCNYEPVHTPHYKCHICHVDRQWDPVHPLLVPTFACIDAYGEKVGGQDQATEFQQVLTLDNGGGFAQGEPACLLNQDQDFFKGAYFQSAGGWYYFVRGEIKSNDATGNGNGAVFTMNRQGEGCPFENCPRYGTAKKGSAFISYKLELLDAPQEYYWEEDGSLYLWTPDGDDPDNHEVEVKTRILGMDLAGKEYVRVKGIRFVGTSLRMENSEHCVVERCEFKYLSHFEWLDDRTDGSYMAGNYGMDFTDGSKGIYISGTKNTIKECVIGPSAGSGVILDGYDNLVQDNYINNCNYAATYHCGVNLTNHWADERYRDDPYCYSGFGHDIIGNKFDGMGKAAITFTGSSVNVSIKPTRILYNEFSNNNLLTGEGGAAVYNFGGTGQYTEIAYNWFHDMGGRLDGEGGSYCVGLDHGSKNFRIHHNVYWRGNPIMDGKVVRFVGYDPRPVAGTWIWNNTVVDSVGCSEKCYTRMDTIWGPNSILALGDTALWNFKDPDNRDYSLSASSPAIDKGESELYMIYLVDNQGNDQITKVMTGEVIDDYEGSAPDLGAYEYGKNAWVAGEKRWSWAPANWNYPPPEDPNNSLLRDVHTGYQPVKARITPTQFSVSTRQGVGYTVRFFDALGNVRKTHVSKQGGTSSVDITNMPTGMYFARIQVAGKSISKRFVLKR